jgi:hypothetical protein
MWLQNPTINLITQPLNKKIYVFAPLYLCEMFKTIKLHAIAALKRSLKSLRIIMFSHSKQLL